jgi:hypothetical protein
MCAWRSEVRGGVCLEVLKPGVTCAWRSEARGGVGRGGLKPGVAGAWRSKARGGGAGKSETQGDLFLRV